jgi:uncharacterized membrane protein YphA (DoxX/SURF4 family)
MEQQGLSSTFNRFSDVIEDFIGRISQPIKPHLSGIARLLIVSTFIEDSIRIVVQWDDQKYFLERYQGYNRYFVTLFLLTNVIVMMCASFFAIRRSHTSIAAGCLFGVILSQSICYGLIFDAAFFLRNLSLTGGLVLLLADAQSKSQKSIFPGLPTLNDSENSEYYHLLGRILLVVLFLAFVLTGEWTAARLIFSGVGLVACMLVAVGFKARWSALFLVALLSIFNIFINNWWTLHANDPQRDFQKYEFFQILSIVGGFLLIVHSGPGSLSVDEKKKAF